jgi:hypothetical protein
METVRELEQPAIPRAIVRSKGSERSVFMRAVCEEENGSASSPQRS